MTIRIFHNPRCSKSRATLTLLQEQGIEPEIILYLETPPEAGELRIILDKLDMSPRELMRTGETEFRQQGLDDKSLTDDELITAMIATPKLIQRPIVLAGDRAAMGRPPESVLDIL
jgi:arsenate reductase